MTAPRRSLGSIAGDCSTVGDSIYVHTELENLRGCYVNTNDPAVDMANPVFVRDAKHLGAGTSVIFHGKRDTGWLGEVVTSTTLDSDDAFYAWNIWHLDPKNYTDGWFHTVDDSCFTIGADELAGEDDGKIIGVDPTDPRLDGTWFCGATHTTISPADFDGIECRPDCSSWKPPADRKSGGDPVMTMVVITIVLAVAVFVSFLWARSRSMDSKGGGKGGSGSG